MITDSAIRQHLFFATADFGSASVGQKQLAKVIDRGESVLLKLLRFRNAAVKGETTS